MKKYFSIFFIFSIIVIFLLSCKSSCNNIDKNVTLSKEAMFYDYDSLINIVKEINPHLEFKNEATGTDILESMKDLRKGIDTCSSNLSFLKLINEAMNLSQDGHSGILPLIYFENSDWIKSSSLESIKRKSINLSYKFTKYIEKIKSSSKIDLPIVYEDGKYLISNSFEYKGVFIEKGNQLKMVNGIDIDKYVNGLSRYKILRWDIQKKKLYDESFYKNLKDLKEGSITLLMQNKKDENVKVDFDLNETIQLLEEKLKLSETPSVNYDDSRKSIYIRIPKMNIVDSTYYISEIRKLSKKEIDSVFIDIRGNRGGSDLVGERVLQNIISDTINYDLKIISKPSIKLAKFLKLTKSEMKETELNYLKGIKYWLIENDSHSLYPDKESINYKGKIFILIDENIFSAAGTMAAYANYSGKIITIGRKTGKLLGRGTTPMVFSLPKSKLLIRVEPVLDIGNAKKVEEIYD